MVSKIVLIVWFIVVTLQLFSNSNNLFVSAKSVSCADVQCPEGTECDDIGDNVQCVPVSCDAANPCGPGEECVPESLQCIRAPCPQFRCVPVTCESKNACEADEECIPSERACITSPCEQFICSKECVFCTLQIPECEPDCSECEIIPQTCDSCSKAVCHDESEACIICPQVIPECAESCEFTCTVTSQSCNECSKAICGGCEDMIPSNIVFLSTGLPAPCEILKKYCPRFSFVQSRCPFTCGLCNAQFMQELAKLDTSLITLDDISFDEHVNETPTKEAMIYGFVGLGLVASLGAAYLILKPQLKQKSSSSGNEEAKEFSVELVDPNAEAKKLSL